MSFPAPTWTNQLAEAAKLSDSELKRHASVLTNNKHELPRLLLLCVRRRIETT